MERQGEHFQRCSLYFCLKGVRVVLSKENLEILVKIIYAVETGGQVYGNCRYDDFTEAYTFLK